MTVDIVKSSKRNATTDSLVGGAYPYNILANKTFREMVEPKNSKISSDILHNNFNCYHYKFYCVSLQV